MRACMPPYVPHLDEAVREAHALAVWRVVHAAAQQVQRQVDAAARAVHAAVAHLHAAVRMRHQRIWKRGLCCLPMAQRPPAPDAIQHGSILSLDVLELCHRWKGLDWGLLGR